MIQLNHKFYIYSKFKLQDSPIFNLKKDNLIIIADINLDKIIPKFISELFNHIDTKNFYAISCTLEMISINFQKDTKALWHMLEQYNAELDYQPFKLALNDLISEYKKLSYNLAEELVVYPRKINSTINNIRDMFDEQLFWRLETLINKEEFQKEWNDYFKENNFWSCFNNYSDIIAVPGITALEKEFSGEVKKFFPININKHLFYEDGFYLSNLEKNGPFTTINNDGDKKQFNHLDNKFLKKLDLITTLLKKHKNISIDNNELIAEEYEMAEKKYLSYILLVQNEFLNFVKHYKTNKNFDYKTKTLTANILIDYLKCHSILHNSKNGLNLSPIKMEGINTKEIIDANKKYINTIFDFCNIFFCMFFNMNKKFKNSNVAFCTLDNTSLPFEIYDFQEITNNIKVIPKISESLFKNYQTLFFENIFSKIAYSDILAVYNTPLNKLEAFLKQYVINHNLKNIGNINYDILISDLVNNPFFIKWHEEIIQFKEKNKNYIPKLDCQMYEMCSKIIYGFWKYIENELIDKNIELLNELNLLPAS